MGTRFGFALSGARAILVLSFVFWTSAPLAQSNPSPLNAGLPVERELRSGESHSYDITLTSGRFVHLTVLQKGIDVAITLKQPGGRPQGCFQHQSLKGITRSSVWLWLLLWLPQEAPALERFFVSSMESVSAESGQETKEPRSLESGKQVEREIAAGETHHYQLALDSGQYLRLAANQKGADISVTLFSPEGKKLIDANSEGPQEPKRISFATDAAGSYGLEIKSLAKEPSKGRYDLKIEELRAATEQDRSRVAAEQAFAEGTRLRLQGTAEAFRQSIEKFEQALSSARAAGDRNLEASALFNTGFVYRQLDEPQRALVFYTQALPIFRTVGDRVSEATLLNNIGVAYGILGEGQKQIEYLNQALPLHRATGNRREEANTLTNIGDSYRALGEIQKAIDHLTQALTIARQLGDRRMESRILTQTGRVFYLLGDQQKALDLYSQALPLSQSSGDRALQAGILNNFGTVHASLGEQSKALDFYNQALPLWRTVGNRQGEAISLNNIGWAYDSMGDFRKAQEHYSQALPLIRAIGDRATEAYMLTNLGRAHSSLGDDQKALDYLNQSLTLRRAVADRAGEASTLYSIARVERKLGNLSEARLNSEAAVRIVDELRGKVASPELRSSFFASAHDQYELYIDLLMQLNKRQPSEGFDARAFETSERGRARSLLDLLAEANTDIRQDIDKGLLERERSVQRSLNAKAARQTRLLSGKHTEQQAAAAAAEVEALTADYKQVQEQIRASSPHYAGLTQPQLLSAKEIQQSLDADTLLLEYALGNERSYLWAISQNSVTSYELPGRTEVEAAARSFYDLVKADAQAEQVGQAAARLSKMLLAPASSHLAAKRLVVVADGALQYLPFAALPAPKPVQSPKSKSNVQNRTADAGPGTLDFGLPLIVDHEIVNLPSASTLAILRREAISRKPAIKALAVLADPVFRSDDSRVKLTAEVRAQRSESEANAPASDTLSTRDLKRSAEESGMGDSLRFARLIGTRREAAAILASVAEKDRKQAFDFEASRATATSRELAGYRIIHFATHGLLNSTHPELSGIVLSLVDERGNPQDGFLRLNEIYDLRLAADLVVLSACQTALGQEIRGEGLIGLTRGFMYAGSPRVMASLWKVDDRATSDLMRLFYEGMLGKQHLAPAAALRAAQIAMLKQKRWQSPYYWASFVLQGEWK